jgi:hypothetical protein
MHGYHESNGYLRRDGAILSDRGPYLGGRALAELRESCLHRAADWCALSLIGLAIGLVILRVLIELGGEA